MLQVRPLDTEAEASSQYLFSLHSRRVAGAAPPLPLSQMRRLRQATGPVTVPGRGSVKVWTLSSLALKGSSSPSSLSLSEQFAVWFPGSASCEAWGTDGGIRTGAQGRGHRDRGPEHACGPFLLSQAGLEQRLQPPCTEGLAGSQLRASELGCSRPPSCRPPSRQS